MRRRRTLIDEYLKTHDPLGPPNAHATGPAVAASRPPRAARLRRMSLPALAVATTLLVVVGIALLPGRATRGGSPFLTAEAAVAAASSDLEESGILHWTVDGGVFPAGAGGGKLEQWLDLRTHAFHAVYPKRPPKASSGSPERVWFNGKRTYRADWGTFFKRADRRKLVVRTVRRRGEPIPESVRTTPIDKLRELLAAAARGDATLAAAPDEQGVPVVKVTKRTRNDAGLQTVTTWMTREQTPRQLRTRTEFKPSAKRLRAASPSVRRQILSFEASTMRFDTWELLPRTPENVAKVRPPEFDPDHYKVVTQFLGPPKR